MGFSDARAALIAALQGVQAGTVQLLHEVREDPEKNQLKRGTVNVANVIEMAKAASGGQHGQNYRTSPHHDAAWHGVTVHELCGIRWQGGEWYVKWFFEEPDIWFISVHQSTRTATPTTGRGNR